MSNEQTSGSAPVAGSFQAQITATSGGLTVGQFVDLPGNVGVCLSGGGSMAMTSGMGQLRGLGSLTTKDGSPLLGQIKAVSTASGGSWLGVTWCYLTPGTSDADFLNAYVADPGDLVPTATAGHDVAETLDQLPPGNLGQVPVSPLFSEGLLFLQVVLLAKVIDVPASLLWQTALGLNLLLPYELFPFTSGVESTSLFSYDQTTLEADVVGPNPALAAAPALLYADATASGRFRRPFLVCNCGLFVAESGTTFQYLAPFQATPFVSGVMGAPTGTDANGQTPGGGGVTSFALDSTLTAVDGSAVTVEQQRQWSLMDIAGSSSAFFASTFQNLGAGLTAESLAAQLSQNQAALTAWSAQVLPPAVHQQAASFLSAVQAAQADPAALRQTPLDLDGIIADLQEIIPAYDYWPVAGAAAGPQNTPSRFADGGDLENTGVASLLSYTDVDSVIAFVNSSDPLTAVGKGVMDAGGQEIAGTRVFVSFQLPPLFGYQPWDPVRGYVLYAGDANPSSPIFKHNQVFDSADFPDLLQSLWSVTGNSGDPAAKGATGSQKIPGANQNPAVVEQSLTTQANAWFGVAGGRAVTLLWCYTNPVQAWVGLLQPDVQSLLQGPDFTTFPNFSADSSHLTVQQINLLASLTAWCVGNAGNGPAFVDLFGG